MEMIIKDESVISFNERIQKYPELHQRFERLLSLVEDSSGDIQKANEAEQRVIEELQQMGNVVLTTWGNQKIDSLSIACDQKDGISRVGKKNSGGIRVTEKSS